MLAVEADYVLCGSPEASSALQSAVYANCELKRCSKASCAARRLAHTRQTAQTVLCPLGACAEGIYSL